MKQTTSVKKIDSKPNPKKKVSAVKNLAKDTQANRDKKKAETKVEPKAKKKVAAKSSTVKSFTKTKNAAPNKTVKQTTPKIKEAAAKKPAKPLTKPKKQAATTATKAAKTISRKKQPLQLQVTKIAPKQNLKAKTTRKKSASVNRVEKPKARKNHIVKKLQSSPKSLVSKTKKPIVAKAKPVAAKTKIEKPKIKLAANTKNAKLKTQKTAVLKAKSVSKSKIEKPQSKKKTAKTIVAAKLKPQATKTKPAVSVKKQKIPVKKIEAVEVKPKRKMPKKPVRPISSAVFRGKAEKYDFKVFQLDEKFENVQAVYIISKRKTDKRKRGHHALVCIGATDALADEIKKHRKGNCLRKSEANVISILAENDPQKRRKIETDLKAAHTIACNLK